MRQVKGLGLVWWKGLRLAVAHLRAQSASQAGAPELSEFRSVYVSKGRIEAINWLLCHRRSRKCRNKEKLADACGTALLSMIPGFTPNLYYVCIRWRVLGVATTVTESQSPAVF